MKEEKNKGVDQKERREQKTADRKTIINYSITKNLNALKVNDS